MKLSRIIISAACFVIVCAVSLIIFFMNDFSNIPTVVQPSTFSATASAATEESTVNNSASNAEDEAASGLCEPEETDVGNSNPKNSKINNSSDFTEPTEKTKTANPVQPSEVSEETVPAQNNTSPESTKATKPQVLPPQTTSDSKAPTNKDPTEASDDVTVATTPNPSPATSPSGEWEIVTGFVICDALLSPDVLTGSGKAYCRLYNADGNLIGDSKLFSNQHIADVMVISSDKVLATYSPVEAGLSLNSGIYYYYFYNENGKDIYQGSVYVT